MLFIENKWTIEQISHCNLIRNNLKKTQTLSIIHLTFTRIIKKKHKISLCTWMYHQTIIIIIFVSFSWKKSTLFLILWLLQHFEFPFLCKLLYRSKKYIIHFRFSVLFLKVTITIMYMCIPKKKGVNPSIFSYIFYSTIFNS